jgi:NAD(P)-dependent dehydrogenase (short-subunit alcohol dehydrogenase family)
MDALTRIRSNGKHLLGLINTVLDIAKIESGQFTLNMAEFAMESVVETVRSATKSLAQNKKLALKTEVAKSLPLGLGDEQRIGHYSASKLALSGFIEALRLEVARFDIDATILHPGGLQHGDLDQSGAGPQCHLRVVQWRDLREDRRSLRSQCANRAFPARGRSQGREAKVQAHACTLRCRHSYRSTCCAIEGSDPGSRLRRFIPQVLWALSFEPP